MKKAGFPSPRTANHKELKQEIWNRGTASQENTRGKKRDEREREKGKSIHNWTWTALLYSLTMQVSLVYHCVLICHFHTRVRYFVVGLLLHLINPQDSRFLKTCTHCSRSWHDISMQVEKTNKTTNMRKNPMVDEIVRSWAKRFIVKRSQTSNDKRTEKSQVLTVFWA